MNSLDQLNSVMIKMMKWFLITIIIFLVFAGCGNRAPEPIHDFTVVIANDPRLPAVPQEKIQQALDRAKEWIKICYKREVTFTVRETVNIDSYVNSRIAGLKISPPNEQRFKFETNDTVTRFSRDMYTLSHRNDIDTFFNNVPAHLKPLFNTDRLYNTFMLFGIYQGSIDYWKEISLPENGPMIDPAHPEKYSFWWWTLLCELQFPEEVTDNLIITNIPLLDDNLGNPAPHTLLRGGMLGGFTWIETPQCLITTFLIYNDIPEIAQYRDRVLDDDEKNRLLSHIIVHEIGAHYLELIKDTYDHANCFAVPTPYFCYGQTLDSIQEIKSCLQPHDHFDRDAELKRRYLALREYNKSINDPERAEQADAAYRKILKRRPDLRD